MKFFMSFLISCCAGNAASNCLDETYYDKTWKRRRNRLLGRLAIGVCCLSMLSFPVTLTAQSQWPFYPLQMGNFWRYQITIHGGIYGYNREAIVDSFMIEGEWFRKKRLQEYTGGEGFTYLRQQDSTFITERPGLGQYAPFRRVYKIDANDGETWLVEISPDDSSRKEWARLDSTAQVTIFGRKRASKHYRFWREHNGELQSTNFRILVDSLGLVQIRGGDGGVDFDDVDLVGAVINGVSYGDPVSVNENTGVVLTNELVVLHYPNPFSAVTHIEVNAKSPLNAQLLHVTVYNLNGQTVRSIYHGPFNTSQPFRTTWNGHDDFGRRLPSGIYFTQARLGRQVQTKQLIFIQ